MTRFSRLLTIFVTVLSVAFMGATAVSTVTWTDWKKVATEQYPDKDRAKQKQDLAALGDNIIAVDKAQQLAVASIDADVKSIADAATGREVELEKLLAQLEQKMVELAEQVELQARKADAKLDELKLRREDVMRLQSQFDELVTQRQASQAEVKRLQDLLFQATAVLDRVERRRKALEAEKSTYDQGEKT